MVWTILYVVGLIALLVVGIWLVASGKSVKALVGVGLIVILAILIVKDIIIQSSPNDNIYVNERQLTIVKTSVINNDLEIKFVNAFNCIIPLLKEELQMKDGTKIYLNESELHQIVESDVCDTLFAYSLTRKAPLYQDSVRILFLTKHSVRSYDYQLFLRNLNASTQIE